MVRYCAKRSGLTERQYRELRTKMFFLQDGTCQHCDKKLSMKRNGWHLHHVDNNCKNNQAWNLQVLCITCHKPDHRGGHYL